MGGEMPPGGMASDASGRLEPAGGGTRGEFRYLRMTFESLGNFRYARTLGSSYRLIARKPGPHAGSRHHHAERDECVLIRLGVMSEPQFLTRTKH